MARVTVRNLPGAVHQALLMRAETHGLSLEAEICAILEAAATPTDRVKFGSVLTSIAREVGGLTGSEANHFDQLRDKTPVDPLRFP